MITEAQENFCSCCGDNITSDEGCTIEQEWGSSTTICHFCIDTLYEYKQKQLGK